MNKDSNEKPTVIIESPVSCGFPSPAYDSKEKSLDFNELLLKHKNATYCLKASGRSLENCGIFDGDILVVDKSLKPQNNDLVIAEYDGNFTAKRLKIKNGTVILHPESDDYEDIIITDKNEFMIFGVISAVVRTLK